ncbi:MAG: DUF2249 domain-containing protein [Chloroflexi bacterium]|nr:DUF2249 domain-containing protein [Chloroflexota bacterium]
MTEPATGDEPILATWRVSEVLRRYPRLLEDLVKLSPAFHHLRNPLKRAVQARLVTVEQAARIAGLEPSHLVRRLNSAAGLTPPLQAANEPSGPVVASPAASEPFAELEVVADLDVRPLLARGEEPYHAIMTTAATVPVHRAFRLHSSFEPLPLFDVLARRGFAYHSRQLATDHWEVVFAHVGTQAQSDDVPVHRREDPTSQGTADTARLPRADADRDQPALTVRIDVSDLVPPEPMVRILEALEQLQAGETLLVEHVRRPVYLYPRLDELGYAHETRDLGPGRVEIRIHKPAVAPGNEQG